MITTFKEFVENNGYERLKEYDVDIWLGKQTIRHITNLLILSDDHIVLSFDKSFDEDLLDGTTYKNTKGTEVFDYTNLKFVCADTMEEALNDFKFILEHKEAAVEVKKRNILSQIVRLGNDFDSLNFTHKRSLGKTIQEGKEYSIFRYVIANYFGFNYDEDVSLTEDDEWQLRDIIHSQRITFDNGNISTFVYLRNIVSVETNCSVEGKSVIVINTTNGIKYYIFKENETNLYNALKFIYK